MKLYEIIGSIVILASLFSSLGFSGEFCYQETANVSSECGGLDTGSYGFGFSDLTYNYQSFYINYTKPSEAISSSLWQVHEGDE